MNRKAIDGHPGWSIITFQNPSFPSRNDFRQARQEAARHHYLNSLMAQAVAFLYDGPVDGLSMDKAIPIDTSSQTQLRSYIETIGVDFSLIDICSADGTFRQGVVLEGQPMQNGRKQRTPQVVARLLRPEAIDSERTTGIATLHFTLGSNPHPISRLR